MDLFGINGQGAATAALALSALALLVSLSLALSRRGAKRQSGDEEELVAVIAAAISAASGMAPGSFRIAAIEAAGTQGEFNTPIWGHVDRIARTPFKA